MANQGQFTVELRQEEDSDWILEKSALPGVMAYGSNCPQTLAVRVLARGVRVAYAMLGYLPGLLLYGCVGTQLTSETTVDFSATGPFSCDQNPITVYGAQVGDPVTLGIPPELLKDKSSAWMAFVSDQDTVMVRRCNISAAPLEDLPPTPIRAAVSHH